MVAIGPEIRRARKALGLSTRAAAAKLGVSSRFLNQLERGKPTARLDKVVHVLHGLGLGLAVIPRGQPALAGVTARKPLLRAIAARHGVRSLSLFGSAARGTAGAQSDLDFLVELEPGRSLVDLVGVKQDLEALFGTQVDTFTPASLKPRVLAAARADLVRIL